MLIEGGLTDRVIGLAIEVHRELGPGLLESAYEACLCFELREAEIPFQRQVGLPVVYKGMRLDAGFRAHLLVACGLILEIKSVTAITAMHEAQILTYLRAQRLPRRPAAQFQRTTSEGRSATLRLVSRLD